MDNLVYQSEKQISEQGDKIPEDKKSELEAALGEGKKVLENQEATAEELNAEKEKISAIVQAFAQEMYAQAGAAGNPDAQGADPSNAGASTDINKADTVDADFEVIDDEEAKK